jgi:ubiquitin-like domain-containing CTD phosphatase 1
MADAEVVDDELAQAIAMSLEQATDEEGGGAAADAPAEADGAAAAADAADAAPAAAPPLDLVFSFNKAKISIQVPAEGATVGDVKLELEDLTGVLAKRQKIVGMMHKGRMASDEMPLTDVRLGKKLMLIGTAEKNIIVEPDPEDLPDVFNDLDVDYSGDRSGKTVRTPDNLMLLSQRIATVDVTQINPARGPGNKLIVFDLDYTLYDCGKESRRAAGAAMELLKRPGADEMLTRLYSAGYEIVIWSATHWKWVEMKLTDLGMLTHPGYKIMAVLDRSAMFRLGGADAKGKKGAHEIKPLEFVWQKLGEGRFSAANTIHIDDLSRNFAFNPQSGLKCSQYKLVGKMSDRDKDTELFPMTKYLLDIAAKVPDWRTCAVKSVARVMLCFLDAAAVPG